MTGRGEAMPGCGGFWRDNQPGFRFTDARPGTARFFAEVERHRYQLEDHIPEVVRFEQWEGREVLEAGSGIATDGIQFARQGARYTALDATADALALGKRRFELEGRDGSFVQGSVTDLPFEDARFDLVYSHGVIHHIADPARAIAEFHRVLRPGGTALVMVYHRSSFNYYVNIMLLRRLLAPTLLIPGASRLVARLTGETAEVLDGHRQLLREHGRRYLTDRQLFLSNNTDGPGNPLSLAFRRAEVARLFGQFDRLETEVHGLNLRIVPGGARLGRSGWARRLGRRYGWHLYARARKAGAG